MMIKRMFNAINVQQGRTTNTETFEFLAYKSLYLANTTKHPEQDFRGFEENFTLVDGIRFSEKILRFYLKLKRHCAKFKTLRKFYDSTT